MPVTAAPTAQHDPAACELCREEGGEVLFRNDRLRVVLVDDPLYPGFCRVVWNAHVKEMTDLAPADRSHAMTVVCKVEASLRHVLAPHKINLASLGNMTPHLHWHVIPRHEDDAHFPQPVWGQRQRTTDAATLNARAALLPQLRAAIVAQCATLAAGA
jgi:diadenosine tetraphosphate (Ap4A) HIT family hydrolase